MAAREDAGKTPLTRNPFGKVFSREGRGKKQTPEPARRRRNAGRQDGAKMETPPLWAGSCFHFREGKEKIRCRHDP
jgi:hypothetical protein